MGLINWIRSFSGSSDQVLSKKNLTSSKIITLTRSMVGSLIISAAEKNDLSPQLIAAVIIQESAGDTFAQRLEQGFFARYLRDKLYGELPGYNKIENKWKQEIERGLRAHSFGLMQIMGQTARENGFMGEFEELFDPETNIDLGSKILSKKIISSGRDIRVGLLRWNGGGNPKYPDEVIERIKSGGVQKLLYG